MKNKKLFAGLAVLLMLVVIVSGCAKEGAAPGAEGEIKTGEEASEAIGDVGTDVEDISSTLEDITEGLASAVRPE